MKINDAMEDLQTAEPHHAEKILECRWSKLLTFGDRGGHRRVLFNGPNKALLLRGGLRITGDDHTCEGAIGSGRQAEPSSRMTATQSPGRCSSKRKMEHYQERSRKALYLVLIDWGLPMAGHFDAIFWEVMLNGDAEAEKIQADKVQGEGQPLR